MASLTLALPGTLVGQGAWRTGGQALPFVEVKPPFAPDTEVLAETALTRGPTFCNRTRDTTCQLPVMGHHGSA